jgi:4-hydroxybenzoate polyprenyltransferase
MPKPLVRRGIKLLFLAIGAAVCLVSVSIFLPVSLRWFTWGTAAGMVVFGAVNLFAGYWKDTQSPEFRSRPTSRTKRETVPMVIGIGIAAIVTVFLRHFLPDYHGWVLFGAILGFVLMFCGIISPLFDKPADGAGLSSAGENKKS